MTSSSYVCFTARHSSPASVARRRHLILHSTAAAAAAADDDDDDVKDDDVGPGSRGRDDLTASGAQHRTEWFVNDVSFVQCFSASFPVVCGHL